MRGTRAQHAADVLTVCAANKEFQENTIREEWIKAMEVRLVREELMKCHRAEGENHYQACSGLTNLYNDLLKEATVRTRRLPLPTH